MTRADNTRYLTQAATRRHQATLRKASAAIAHLDSLSTSARSPQQPTCPEPRSTATPISAT
jgi:hypothetical protein